jgi:Bacterial SH3 domain
VFVRGSFSLILQNAIFAKAIYNYSKRARNVRETIDMKRCPQCNRVFEDSLDYCTDDGIALVDENFVLPSEASPIEAEAETVIHHEPITINIPNSRETSSEQSNQQITPSEQVIPIIIEKPGNTGKYFLFLVIGLILGGVLVLGAVFLIYTQLSRSNTGNDAVQTSSGKHNERNKTRKDAEFNGLVLSENANIRSAPTEAVLDVLPQNDRLNILERDGAWYRVVCEHGVGGWMHGNTIRFNDDETPF